MNGYTSKYLYYESNKNSIITIPRPIIEANNLNWGHKEDIGIIVKTIDGKQGLFLWKREKEINTSQKTRAQVIEYEGKI